ncbi:hypothetical protein F2Q69_00022263 [Brassica cretica]|uniref:Uncharacterized protein n=1 Tax=Brassica cretica TaxID=69181 RepID=A0A8S9QCX2_BRACR|nr:hypothetical protein F2Q69_00022263 [Brassica cretica]
MVWRSSFYSSEAFFTDYGDIAVLVRSGGAGVVLINQLEMMGIMVLIGRLA